MTPADDAANGREPGVPPLQAEPVGPSTDVAGTVSEMKRLLTQLESADGADAKSRDLLETMRVNTRMLQYIHEAHTRMAETLKRADRSDLVIQSADALNQTFRQLRQSQEQLANSLAAERRRRPWIFAAATLVSVAVLAGAGWWLLQYARDDFDARNARMAKTEASLVASGDVIARVEKGNAELKDLFDQGLASNRVLVNETRAQLAEIQTLKGRMGALETERADAVTTALTSKEQLAALDAELQRSHAKLLEMENEQAALVAQLEQRAQEAAAALAAANAANAGAPPAMNAADAAKPPADSTPAPAPTAAVEPPQAKDEPPAPEQPPVVAAVNQVLDEAGIDELALLAAAGVKNAALDAPTFSIRTAEGFPIGFHQAEFAHLRVDPTTRLAELVLTRGSTMLRGEREDFSLGDKVVPLGLLLEGAWERPELASIVELAPKAMPAEAIAPLPGVDVAAARRDLNQLLRDDGYGTSDLTSIARIEWVDGHVRLRDVTLDQKGGGGLVTKTVKAAWCDVLVDDEARTVALRFQNGSHVMKDREIPFFQGAGDAVGTWSMPLTRATIQRWHEFATQLHASLPSAP